MTSSDPDGQGQGFAIDRDPRLRIIIPSVVATAFLVEQLDSTIIVTAVPEMARSLGTTPLAMNLAVTAYILTLAMFIPVSGWFADRWGARRVFALALAIFTLGSVLCGLATSFPMLVATRALQGLGGAMMTPVGRLILLRSFPRAQLVTAMTYMTLPSVIGPLIGPLLGGVLTTYASWRWIFFVNVPFGLLGMFMALRFIDDLKGAGRVRFDFPGFLMVGAGVVLLQYGLENIGRPTIPIPAIAGAIGASILLLLFFIRYAKTAIAPAVDLTLFRLKTFRIGTLAGGVCRIGINGVPFVLPLMLQVGFGLSPVVSGSLTFVSAISSIIARPALTRLLRRFGFAMVLSGSAVSASVTMAAFALLQPDTPHAVIATMAEQLAIVGGEGDLGGTMRLGAYDAVLTPGTIVHELYGTDKVSERHRHRYEVNNAYRDKLEEAGLVISGVSPDTSLVEFVELPRETHPYFVATQAHPEFKSRPTRSHPLFRGLVAAALAHHLGA